MCVVKLLKWVAIAINSILLTAGIIIAIFGVILWKTDFNSFGDDVKDLIPKAMAEKTGEPPSVPPIFAWLGKLVMAFGLFIVGLAILGIFALCCCSDKCKLCLIIYLIILVVLVIVQAAVVGLSFNTSTLEKQVKEAITPIFTDEKKRESSMQFILGTQTFLKCCAVEGYKDYYCADVYDPFCNFGCQDSLSMKGKALPICPANKRDAKGTARTTGVCAADASDILPDVLKYPNEPMYSDIGSIPDALLKKPDGGIATKPSDLPGCTKGLFDEINANLKYVQITCIVILCIELFLMVVTILLICKQKGGGG